MNNNDQTKLKNAITEFLNMLNDGNKITISELNQNHKDIKDYIYKLGVIDNFPISYENETIFCTIIDSRKTFDKYHIEDIVDVLLEFKNNKINITNKDYSRIILDYIKNNKNGKHIDNIILDFAAGNKNCLNSKNIKQIILENATKKRTHSEETLMEKIVEYATNTKYAKDIANIIINFEKDLELDIKMQDILKEINLPRRDDKVYKIISSYESYELTHCISYEMAIRNKDVIALLKDIKSLTILSKRLFEYYISFGDIEIKENFYLEKDVTEALELLNHYEITQNFKIKFKNYKLLNTYTSIIQIITDLIIILEENYYMIYDRKDIVPDGMEEFCKEPNHYESDIELNQHMNKVIEELMKNAYNTSPRYKNNNSVKDGYVTYQASYEDSKEYDINKIFPNFKRPMREFNQTQVAFNMSLPKDEIMAYIEKIKDDYDNKDNSYKTLNQLLYADDTRIEDKLEHKQQDRYADDFFIYDYYTQSDEVHEKKLESIQKKLSQFHGMKVENGRNNYKIIDYDEALIKLQSKSSTSSNSFTDIAKKVKESEHIIHYIETIKIIENRFEVLKKAIDDKKYKTLIHHG